jgi:hypothetical protein
VNEELVKTVDEYLDKFLSSDLVMIKIKDEKYPPESIKRMLLRRIEEKKLQNVTAYMFMKELYLEKI